MDSNPVVPLHTHRNPITGASVVRTWPCPQCVALGRTEPLRYVSDGGTVPEDTSVRATEIPPDRLEAYLASFSAPPATNSGSAGGSSVKRRDRRKAERQARRKNR